MSDWGAGYENPWCEESRCEESAVSQNERARFAIDYEALFSLCRSSAGICDGRNHLGRSATRVQDNKLSVSNVLIEEFIFW